MRALVRQHPLISYFTLAIAISWGGILAVVAGGPIPAPPSEAERLFTWVYLAMLAGPSIAGILLTWLVSGGAGLREFGRRLRAWRVGARWYGIALLTAPILLCVTLLVLSLGSGNYIPGVISVGEHDPAGPIRTASRMSVLAMGLAVGIGAGFFEELGWTGFATPEMRKRYGSAKTGLVIGLLWGAWHFLAILWGAADAFGNVPIPLYLLFALFSFLPPYRILMVKVHDQTGSLLVAVLMHASLTANMLILGPSRLAGTAMLAYQVVFALTLWVAVWFASVSRPRVARVQPAQ